MEMEMITKHSSLMESKLETRRTTSFHRIPEHPNYDPCSHGMIVVDDIGGYDSRLVFVHRDAYKSKIDIKT
jgi:hypothetical protein